MKTKIETSNSETKDLMVVMFIEILYIKTSHHPHQREHRRVSAVPNPLEVDFRMDLFYSGTLSLARNDREGRGIASCKRKLLRTMHTLHISWLGYSAPWNDEEQITPSTLALVQWIIHERGNHGADPVHCYGHSCTKHMHQVKEGLSSSL